MRDFLETRRRIESLVTKVGINNSKFRPSNIDYITTVHSGDRSVILIMAHGLSKCRSVLNGKPEPAYLIRFYQTLYSVALEREDSKIGLRFLHISFPKKHQGQPSIFSLAETK